MTKEQADDLLGTLLQAQITGPRLASSALEGTLTTEADDWGFEISNSDDGGLLFTAELERTPLGWVVKTFDYSSDSDASGVWLTPEVRVAAL
jgi:hypothetical protein